MNINHQDIANPTRQPPNIRAVADPGLYSKILVFRARSYRQHFPDIQNPDAPDIYDFGSFYFTSLNTQGEITSCSRLVQDSTCGLPSEKYLAPYLAPYRNQGVRLAEFGRMVVAEKSSRIAIAHFAQAFNTARQMGIQQIAMVSPWAKCAFFTQFLEAQILCADISEDYGSGQPFAIYLWCTATCPRRLIPYLSTH